MSLARRWAGHAYGTNTGNVFLTLEGADQALTGVLRLNEPGVGIAVYSIQGAFAAPTLTLTGQPQAQIEGVQFGDLTVNGALNARGELRGTWETTIGSAGTFVLFPHDAESVPDHPRPPEQFHTARYNFGAIEIDRDQITEVAEGIRSEFPNVIVTVVAGTEQSRYLDDFKQLQFTADKADSIKIFAQKPDGLGSNQVISIEFGPQFNVVMTQGASEAWVVGRLETLKRDLKRFERAYATNIKRWGIGINQLMLVATIVFLPSLEGLRDRAILMGAVLALIIAVNWSHTRYLPFAVIHLRKKAVGWWARFWPSVGSWLIALTAGAAATLLAAYLQGWLAMPKPTHSDQSVENRDL